MKKVFVLISVFFLFFSCTSKNIIPGAKQLEIDNIYNEYIYVKPIDEYNYITYPLEDLSGCLAIT